MNYSAEKTNGITSYMRRNAGDISKAKILADDELFEFIDTAIDKICEDTRCLTEPVIIELAPGKTEYNSSNVVDDLSKILMIEDVKIVKSDNIETVLYELDPVFDNDFTGAVNNTCYSYPAIYNKTQKGIRYYQPIGELGYSIIIDCARQTLRSEHVGYDKDPIILGKFERFVKYGAMVELAAAYPDLNISV